LRDYDLIIKDQEKSINQHKKMIVEKETINRELKQEFNEISARFKNLSMKLSMREEDYKKLHNEYENKLGSLEDDKYRTEEKVSELIDIVKQQSKELSDFSVQIQIVEKEKKLLQKNIEKMKSDYEELCKANIDLKQHLNVINDLKRKINETDQVTTNLQREVEAERMTNSNLVKANHVKHY
jgi:chromosome segregation ATPase